MLSKAKLEKMPEKNFTLCFNIGCMLDKNIPYSKDRVLTTMTMNSLAESLPSLLASRCLNACLKAFSSSTVKNLTILHNVLDFKIKL